MDELPDVVDALLLETRKRRHALHDLVARVRRDHDLWHRELGELARRPRLTSEQRNEFRRRIVAARWW